MLSHVSRVQSFVCRKDQNVIISVSFNEESVSVIKIYFDVGPAVEVGYKQKF